MTLTLRDIRERIVREHMESENRHEFDVTMGTFQHPRYEIVPTGEVHDGTEAVDRYFRETRAAFPDQRNELIAMHHGMTRNSPSCVPFSQSSTSTASSAALRARGRPDES
jgi:hypothetical protein